MKAKMFLASLIILVFCVLLAACASNEPITVIESKEKNTIETAKKLIQQLQNNTLSGVKHTELIDITPTNIWDLTGYQLFKEYGGSSSETYIVNNQKAVHIGNGFGGFGVTSAVPYDVNNDGNMDIVYAYSFGSGIHRSAISWIDLKSFTEHQVEDLPNKSEFRMEDVILKIENKDIVVYRIAGMDESKVDIYSFWTYPSDKDIEYMVLEKDGVLYWENNKLVNEGLTIEALPLLCIFLCAEVNAESSLGFL
ncbi:hypothetical protein [Paenibacillus sp. NEAU-GSW1]|uniref:hypothetical protein n=1 Tax=Paenibacillus sp. NEAU-GSW1 TaxID=2682486 RepID=UPI0012E1A525|nr:hypothetical protein [Paenibacillus sp. NEAU-GSW1]MUT68815.1 hypothetical protein [Paenibacillus sp. NEAU-GSW1]